MLERNEDLRIAYIDVVESIRNGKPSTEYYLKLVKSDIHGKDKVKFLLLITVSKGFTNSKGALANPLSPTKDPLGRIDRGAIQIFYFERYFQVTQTTDSCLLPLIYLLWDLRIVPFCCGIGHILSSMWCNSCIRVLLLQATISCLVL
ncbi:uncharacterized protein [Lolium perenne]|uniref:uncharacterized protein isoform X1 n=1 Tax=Lolium perenne TaxID=4522 RepID=UPI0021F62874|nr:uncharacterized protein LOC127299345 isoform X1 [Lolium perenne]XP_051185259.1 uncharacterized protein LOC127299345 isoform X1 [Lolium perenne]